MKHLIYLLFMVLLANACSSKMRRAQASAPAPAPNAGNTQASGASKKNSTGATTTTWIVNDDPVVQEFFDEAEIMEMEGADANQSALEMPTGMSKIVEIDPNKNTGTVSSSKDKYCSFFVAKTTDKCLHQVKVTNNCSRAIGFQIKLQNGTWQNYRIDGSSIKTVPIRYCGLYYFQWL